MSLPHRIVKRAGRTCYYATWFDRETHQQHWRKLAQTMPVARRALALLQDRPNGVRRAFTTYHDSLANAS